MKKQTQATREQRITRATELIRQHPDWGKDRINAKLQKEYGQGLQRIYVARLKSETLAPSLTPEQRREKTLISKGLLPSEAKALSGLPLTAPVIRAFVQERQAVLREARKNDVPLAKINQEIKLDYRIGGYTRKGKTDYGKAFDDWAGKYIEREKIKKEVAYSAPGKVTYTREQNDIRKELRAAGFTAYEARILAKGDKTVQAFGSQTWKDAMAARTAYINHLKSMGWSWKQIKRELDGYYQKGVKRTPFDHIRKYDSYKAPKPQVEGDELTKAIKRQKQRTSRGRKLATRRVQSYFQGALGMGL